MATRWHVNPRTGNPGRCSADPSNPQSRGCRFNLGANDHYRTASEAALAYEDQQQRSGAELFGTVSAESFQVQTAVKFKAASPREPFWKRNARRLGEALVAVFTVPTATSLEEPAAVEDQGFSTEEPLPQSPADSTEADTSGGPWRASYENLTEAFEKSKVDRKAFVDEFIRSSDPLQKGWDDVEKLIDPYYQGENGSELPSEVADGVLFQGKSLRPTPEEIDAAQRQLDALVLRRENRDYVYDRAEQFGRSFDTGLVGKLEHRDITDGVFRNQAGQSRAIAGSFIDPYTGEPVEIGVGELSATNVDHVVPLHEVIQSQDPANPLTPQQRHDIANDPDNLQVVSGAINRSKNDRDPGEWMPPNRAAHARYAIAVINIKSKYGLSVDQDEYDALVRGLDTRR